jgi:general secretion pathway protein G
VPKRRRIETWGGFALGVLITPLFLLVLGKCVRAVYDGTDPTGEAGIAVVGVRDLAAAIDRYRARYHHIPDEKQGLSALVPDFIEHIPTDPWGNAYVYQPNTDWADVLSYGPDGRPGGDGTAADISARFGRLASRPSGLLYLLTTVVLTGLALAATYGARRYQWCNNALSGMSAFWGVMVLITVGMPLHASLHNSIVPWLSFIVSVACLVGAIAVWRGLPFGRALSLLSLLVAYMVLQYLVTA